MLAQDVCLNAQKSHPSCNSRAIDQTVRHSDCNGLHQLQHVFVFVCVCTCVYPLMVYLSGADPDHHLCKEVALVHIRCQTGCHHPRALQLLQQSPSKSLVVKLSLQILMPKYIDKRSLKQLYTHIHQFTHCRNYDLCS